MSENSAETSNDQPSEAAGTNNIQAPDSEIEKRRSEVRIRTTYAAVAFLFGGGSIFILFLIWTRKLPEALNLFQTILPVSAAIISFWFAGRGGKPK